MLAIRLHAADNVLVARAAIARGTALVSEPVVAASDIPPGHKIAARDIARGAPVLRYGQVIGVATADIAAGMHVHLHNLAGQDSARQPSFSDLARPTDYVASPAAFQGIMRKDGRVATRNYIGILTSVNCSATVAGMVADAFRRNPLGGPDPLAAFPNVDGVVALAHKTGCGMEREGEGMDVLRRTLAGFARHPNFHGVLVVGLGCEGNQIGDLVRAERLVPGERLETMTIQDSGGTRKTVERAVARIREMLPAADRVRREPVPAAHLVVALQCGGSDGLSGITANPALGAASDLVVRHGGTVVLAETPETYGAEHLLVRRAVSREVGEKLLARMRWWEGYLGRHGARMNANPSPGNQAGGITTIVEKSLGAAAKAGTTNLVDVIGYAEPVAARGFVFMDTPGFDPVSATGQVAGGANLVCFTTGRGSVFGCVPAPSLKLASNTALFERMPEDMDLDCGGIADGRESVAECGRRIFERILKVASGEPTKSEAQGFGESEFAPWQLGAVV